MMRQLTHRVLARLPVALALLVLGAACASKLDNPSAFHNPNTTASGGTGGTATGGGGAGGTTTGGGGTGGAGGTATGGGGTGGTAAAPCDAPTLVFMVDGPMGGCNGATCHIPTNSQVFPPDLITPGVAARVKDVASLATGSCPGRKYVDSANIENSLILKKLQTQTPPTGCGLQMPFGLPMTSQDKIDCIRSWVTAVAAGTL